MKIYEVIAKIKAYHRGIDRNGNPIDEKTTRDQILYGNPNQECTKIVTSCWATTEVIRKAKEMGANLIITHEALFWNHGDHTDWLKDNAVFQKKKQLLDEGGIVVWRDHDYIHSGIPQKDGSYKDGIWYGVMKTLGWEKYLVGNPMKPMNFILPEIKAHVLAKQMAETLNLNAIRIIGDPDTLVKKVWFVEHVIGNNNEQIKRVDEEEIDLLIPLELIDFTLSEYIRDAQMNGIPKAIFALGHFNAEEYGMKYMVEYLNEAIGETIPAVFIQSGDMYTYVTRN